VASFGYPKHKQKTLDLHNKILELEIHFESKLTLIQWLNEEDYIKPMYIKYITYNFSIAIGLHVCG